MQTTAFHLYHHQPDPLPLTSFADRAWLINNACCYSVVAVIEAPDAATALHAAQCKAEVRRLPRATVVRAGNLLRKTLPGDVLVTSTRAWMVDASGQVCPIASQKSASWKRIDLHSTVDALAWSPDGRLLAAAENDRRVVLLSLQSENAYPPAYRRGEYAAAERLAWSPDGTRLASTGSQSEVHLWKPAAWRTTGFHTGYTGSILICGIEDVYCPYEHVYALAWSPDGRQIVAGREDGCLLSWDTSTGGDYHCQKRHARAITALAFSPRETHSLFTASADATVRLWDEATGKEQWRAEQSGRVMAAVWSPDGRLIASCEENSPAVSLWNHETGKLVACIPLSTYTTQEIIIHVLAWSPDGTLLAAGCDDGTVQLLDPSLLQHVETYWTDSTYQQTVNALAWSPDSILLASGGTGAVVKIWQVRSEPAPDAEAASSLLEEESAR